MNEKQQRLKIYKKALLHYRLSFWIWPLRLVFLTDMGFCLYLTQRDIVFITGRSRLKDYPELLMQRKSNAWKGNIAFWWNPNRMWPRIQALKRAIKLCEE